MQQPKDRWTPNQAWEKMKHFCAYQERCQQEVYQKMRAASLTAEEADTIISRLIEENYLNEERYARQFAGGHFRLKKWGKQKIVYALKQKQISDYCIRKAMEEIGDDAYTQALHKLARAKWAAIRTGTPAQRWAKTKLFLLQKGYLGNEVQAVLQQLQRGDLEE
ncbi:MAG: RecX family transcriptional regulator [Chitinophagaceae bacterium]|nr:RecX family transcriptional regulator [Chitinophagaceae bacterium]